MSTDQCREQKNSAYMSINGPDAYMSYCTFYFDNMFKFSNFFGVAVEDELPHLAPPQHLLVAVQGPPPPSLRMSVRIPSRETPRSEQVYIEIIVVNLQVFLAGDKTEAGPQRQQEIFQVA